MQGAAVVGDHIILLLLLGNFPRNIVRRNNEIISGRADGHDLFIADHAVRTAQHQKAVLQRAVPRLSVGKNRNGSVAAVAPVVLLEAVEVAELEPAVNLEGLGILARVIASLLAQLLQRVMRDVQAGIVALHGVEAPLAHEGRDNDLLFGNDKLFLQLIGKFLEQRRKTGRGILGARLARFKHADGGHHVHAQEAVAHAHRIGFALHGEETAAVAAVRPGAVDLLAEDAHGHRPVAAERGNQRGRHVKPHFRHGQDLFMAHGGFAFLGVKLPVPDKGRTVGCRGGRSGQKQAEADRQDQGECSFHG